MAFVIWSDRDKAGRMEAERAQLDAQLRTDSAQLHELSREVDILSARVGTAALNQEEASPPRLKAALPQARSSTSPRLAADVTSKLPSTSGSHVSSDPVGQGAPQRTAAMNYAADIEQLNGSAATNHEQLLKLEQQGARHYVEFALKRNDFRKIGTLWVELRKVDQKHSYYNLSILVDGHRIEKVHINILEPIWVATAQNPMQYQLVANSLSPNRISGYLSEPKLSKAVPSKAPQTAVAVNPDHSHGG